MSDQLIDAERQGRLISHLCELYLGRSEISELVKVISGLHNEKKIELLSPININALEQLEHNDFWSVQHMLTETIPLIECDTQSLLIFAKTLIEKAGNDGVAYAPASSLTTWCQGHPQQAHEILQGAREGDELSLFFGGSALKGVDDFKLMDEFTDSNKDSLLKIGLRAMALSSNALAKESAKHALDRCLQTLKNSTEEETKLTAIDCAFRVWDDNAKAGAYLQKDIIDHVIDDNNEGEKQKLLSCLFYHHKGLTKRSIASLLDYAATPSNQPEIILRLIDHALHGIDERWNFEQVVTVFDAHMPNLSSEFDTRELFHFFDIVWKDKDKTSHVIASWLNRGDFVQCNKLVDAMNESSEKGSPVSLLKQHLPSGVNDQIFMARKCVGFLWHREVTAASILLSLYKNSKKAAQEAIELLLFDPLLLSYGGDLRDYLETQRTNNSKRISSLVERLLDKHDQYLEDLRTPDNLVEFHPSTDQRRAASVRDRERDYDIQKQARQRSVFASLMNTEILLYGRSSFTTIHHGDGQTSSSVMQMQEMSFSTELPRLMVVDPAGFQQMLSIFRIEKRISQ